MTKTLRYIGISHKTASLAQRVDFHISDQEKDEFLKLLCSTFSDISGLLLLATCNRTEIFFEATNTTANELRDFFIDLKVTQNYEVNVKLFGFSNNTEDTVRHLLEVSSGLDSSILGDAEIIHQIKKGHQFSVEHQLQGSLLERALQSVFKSHKRVSNETHFRDGTTSVAYKSLKVIRDTFSKESRKTKKILFVGAGDIVKNLFKYNSKFNFSNIYISNRTESKAIALAKTHRCKVYNWNKVLDNDFEDFDVIISAAKNCQNLIHNVDTLNKPVLLIDLAVPCNIDNALAKNKNIIFFDLDSISAELEDTREKRLAAIDKVDLIIDEELEIYCKWIQEAPLRALLKKHKITVNQKVSDYFEIDTEKKMIDTVSNNVMRKLMSHPEKFDSDIEMNTVISEQISILTKTKN